MSAVIRVEANTDEATKAIAALGRAARPAIARAINRTASSGQTAMVRVVSKDLGLPAKTTREAILVDKATPEQLTATFRASARRIPLIEFRARGNEPSRGKGNGVTAKLPGGAGRYPSAFITTVGKGGHRGVFVRRGQKRLPIVELRGPSIWQSFETNMPAAIARINEQLPKNLQHELQFALSRA